MLSKYIQYNLHEDSTFIRTTIAEYHTFIESPNFLDNIHTIKFEHDFNENIDTFRFPNSLHTLLLGIGFFNQSLDNVKFPKNLEILKFGVSYDHKLDNIQFPDSLHTIAFCPVFMGMCSCFNQNIDKVRFPHNLSALYLSSGFGHSLNNVKFPNGMTILGLGHNYDHDLSLISFPDSLHTLDLHHCSLKFIKKCSIPYHIKKIIVFDYYIGIVRLPYSCTEETCNDIDFWT